MSDAYETIPLHADNTLPWERLWFGILSNGNEHIDIQMLIDAYAEVVGGDRAQRGQVSRMATDILGQERLSFQEFVQTMRWCGGRQMGTDDRYIIKAAALQVNRYDWHKNAALLIIGAVDVAIVAGMCGTVSDLQWAHVAYAMFAIAGMSTLYMATMIMGIQTWLPTAVLARLPVEHARYYRCVLHIKCALAMAAYLIAYLLQIRYVLRKCANGCTARDAIIVNARETPTVISWSFFLRRSEIWIAASVVISLAISIGSDVATAVALWSILVCGVVLRDWPMVAITVLTGAMIIWRLRYRIRSPRIRVELSATTSTYGCVSVNKERLHDGTLIWVRYLPQHGWLRGVVSVDESHLATISVNRQSDQANLLCQALIDPSRKNHYVNIGGEEPSQFRMAECYALGYFFCADVAIQAFLRNIHAMSRHHAQCLIWTVSDPAIVKEFAADLANAKQLLPYLKLRIFCQYKTVSNCVIERFSYLQQIIHRKYGIDIAVGAHTLVCSSFMPADELTRLAEAVLAAGAGTTVGVFVGGPREYVEHLRNVVRLARKNDRRIAFRFWSHII